MVRTDNRRFILQWIKLSKYPNCRKSVEGWNIFLPFAGAQDFQVLLSCQLVVTNATDKQWSRLFPAQMCNSDFTTKPRGTLLCTRTDEVQCLSGILTGDVRGHKGPGQSEALAETQRQQNHGALCKAYGPPEHTGQDEREEETTPTTQPETRTNTLFQRQQMKIWSPEKKKWNHNNFLSAVKIKRVHCYWALIGAKLAENFSFVHTL